VGDTDKRPSYLILCHNDFFRHKKTSTFKKVEARTPY
jgi:hypothetical protein